MYKPKLIATVLLVTCVGLFVAVASARKLGLFSGRSQRALPHVTNKIGGVRILNLQRNAKGGIELTLSNDSSKAIYAYTIITSQKSLEKGMTSFMTDAPILPGQTKVERLSPANFDSADGGNPDHDEISLSAAYFEGGAVEGDARHADKLQQMMLGMKEQAMIALRILRDAYASGDQDSGRILDTAQSQIPSIPGSPDSDAAKRSRDLGSTRINLRLATEIGKLRTTVASRSEMKARMAEIISHYQQLVEKL